MPRVVVVGAGISGLAAAETLAAADRRLDVIVLERAGEVGGKARTFEQDGWRVECGPTAYLDREPVLEQLVQRAGLEKLRAAPAAARRFVYARGRRREVRANPLRLVGAGVLGPLGLLRAFAEPFVRRRRGDEDESIHAFVARRFGRQIADRLVTPFLRGVYAGDATQLSVRAAVPQLRDWEREHGSVVRALFARRRRGGGGARAGTCSFAAGMQALPHALAAGGRYRVELRCPVRALVPDGGGWRIHVDPPREPIPADAVVLAADAPSLAALLPPALAPLGRELAAIPHPPIAIVALGYAPTAALPAAYGALVAPASGPRCLGVLHDSDLFPGRAPPGARLLRVMFGGTHDPAPAQSPDAELLALARESVAQIHDLRDAPIFIHVHRVPAAIPQYDLEHPARVARIDALLARHPTLALATNLRHGVSFPRAALAGKLAGEDVLRVIGGPGLGRSAPEG